MNKKHALLMFLAAAGMPVVGGGGGYSEPVTVVTSPSSVYWTTLTSRQSTFACLWPENASSATLNVSGAQNIAEQTFTRDGTDALLTFDLTLEIPSTFEEEGLCTFTLTFDNGEVLSRRLASIRGVDGTGTRVVVPDDLTSRAWQRVSRKALIPIVDEGVETVSLNGTEVDAELNGYCGWFEWKKMPAGENLFVAHERTATFISIQGGLRIVVR